MDLLLNFSDGLPDFSLHNEDILGDNTLYTAVLVSLFTDKRADSKDELPPEYLVGIGKSSPDLRGFWGDSLYGESIGSKLWLLKREKQMPRILVLAKQYAEEALQWLLRDGYCTKVSVLPSNERQGFLNLKVVLEVNSLALPLESDLNPEWTFTFNAF